MNYTLLRNAAALLTIGGTSFLIDPALDPAGARPPVPNTPNQHPNPVVELPDGWREVVEQADAYLVTHLHRDHFDDASVQLLDKTLPLYCQPEDIDRLSESGLERIVPVDRISTHGDVTISRTRGQHGTGEVGLAMAPVSGFVFEAPNDSRVYLTGDTIWYEEVAAVIAVHQPDVIIVNAGGARFLEGDPIVMTAEDIAQVHLAAPDSLIGVVHLEAINHCLETRSYYRQRLPEFGVAMDRIRIPEDGEAVIW